MGPKTSMLILFLLCVTGTTTDKATEGCSDPPWNNDLAAIIVEALELARPILVHGIPNLGIPPLDPLGPLGHIVFHVDTSALKLDGSVNDTQVINLSQYIICHLNLTIGLTQKFDIDLRLENLHMQGFYGLNGMAFSVFPVFGHGHYKMDVFNTGVKGGAKIAYNPFTDHASIKNLKLDVFFQKLELVMECILGCGDISDMVNSLISDIAPPMFFAIWDAIKPILTKGLEDGINDVLKNISISDIIKPDQILAMELGNANEYMDLVMQVVDGVITNQGLDPAPLPQTTLSFGLGEAELYEGLLTGLSTFSRSGTSTIDEVADWVFLYANVAVNDLTMHYRANVTSDVNTATGVLVDTSIEQVAIYLVARANTYDWSFDLDQFVITEFGKIDVTIDGLGLMDYILGPLTEAMANMVHEDVANILETKIKDIIQNALNDTPWTP